MSATTIHYTAPGLGEDVSTDSARTGKDAAAQA
jgi:hypothetical protein